MPRLTACATVFFCLTIYIAGPLAHAQVWRPYAELEGRAGGDAELGPVNLFVPFWQDNSSMLFLDVRGYPDDQRALDDQSTMEGNWGLAYRTVLPSEWIFGINGFFDQRHTEYENRFSQVGFGLELLDVNSGFRANAYIPDGEVKSVAGQNSAFLQDGNIVVRQGLEASYWGVDFEAERRMWFSDGDDNGDSSSVDFELWASAGIFYFDNNGPGFEKITGPQLRTELRMFDIPLLGNDSRLVFAGQYEHDDVRGSQSTGIASVRIPFGPGGRRRGRQLKGLARRMVAPIERDIDIVTNAGAFGAVEAANFANTGTMISQAVTIDGNTVGPEGVAAGTGVNSVVIANGDAGDILPSGPIVLNNGQVLLGGDSNLAVIGSVTGTPATFNAPGSRPTINNPNNGTDTIVVAPDSSVIGVDVTGGRHGIATLGFGDLTAASQILNNNVSDVAIDGFSFANVNGTVANNTATDSGDNGFLLLFGNVTGTFANNTATGSRGLGFFLLGSVNAGGTVTGNTATGSGDFGFFLFDAVNAGGTVNGNTATDNGRGGFFFGDVNVGGTVTGNTATDNGSGGFFFGHVNAGGTVTGNTATGSGRNAAGVITNANANGFSFASNSGTFTDNRSIFNANDGFSRFGNNPFNQNAGTFTGNVANTNGDMGYRGNNNAGTVNTNTGTGNTGGGNTFP